MRRFGLIGKDISYSFSPGYFREKFDRLGISDCSYEIFDLPSLDQFPQLLKNSPDLAGLNVTIPYKEAIVPYLDHLDMGRCRHRPRATSRSRDLVARGARLDRRRRWADRTRRAARPATGHRHDGAR